jgi:hypothetical protein
MEEVLGIVTEKKPITERSTYAMNTCIIIP